MIKESRRRFRVRFNPSNRSVSPLCLFTLLDVYPRSSLRRRRRRLFFFPLFFFFFLSLFYNRGLYRFGASDSFRCLGFIPFSLFGLFNVTSVV